MGLRAAMPVCAVRAEKHRLVVERVDGRMAGNTTRAVRRRNVDGIMIRGFPSGGRRRGGRGVGWEEELWFGRLMGWSLETGYQF